MPQYFATQDRRNMNGDGWLPGGVLPAEDGFMIIAGAPGADREHLRAPVLSSG